MRHLLTFSKGDAAQKQQQAGGINPPRRSLCSIWGLPNRVVANTNMSCRRWGLQDYTQSGLQDRSTTLMRTVSGKRHCNKQGGLLIELNKTHRTYPACDTGVHHHAVQACVHKRQLRQQQLLQRREGLPPLLPPLLLPPLLLLPQCLSKRPPLSLQ